MKTKICKHCKEEINKKAKRCPKCGGKLGMNGFLKAFIIIVVIFLCICACANSCSEAIQDELDSYKDINGNTTFRINESFESKHEKITMLEVNTDFTDYNSYLGPADGYKILMAKFEVENISKDDDELYVSYLEFNASVDGVVAEHYIYAPDNYKTLTATVGKGKKTVGYIFYEIPVNANAITIDYDPNFFEDGESIEFIVN